MEFTVIYDGGEYVHLKEEETTFPELFQEAGYTTALIGKWHCSHNDEQESHQLPSMTEYGFDYYYGSDNNTIIKDKPRWWKNQEDQGTQEGLAADIVGRETLLWLREGRDDTKPFLLSVHFYEPHWRVDGPENLLPKYEQFYDDNKQRAHYPSVIENVDKNIGSILNELEHQGLSENTIVIFTSDHGPASFQENHRAYERNDGSSFPFRGYKYGLWDGSVHVPGFIKWPGVTKAGDNIETPVGGIDFLPTLCAMVGIDIPSSLSLDGIDFSPLLEGKKLRRDIPLQWHYYNATLKDSSSPRAVLRKGDFIICGFYENDDPIGTGRWYPTHMAYLKRSTLTSYKLFNLKNDPEQLVDISESKQSLFRKMSMELSEYHIQLQKDAYGWEKEAKQVGADLGR